MARSSKTRFCQGQKTLLFFIGRQYLAEYGYGWMSKKQETTGKRRMRMENSKDELIRKIESARLVLNKSIDENHNYDEIYKNSVELDRLIEEYIIAGY